MPILSAAENECFGFLNVVNMIPSTTSIEIHLAEKKLVPNGLKPAAETGWFMIPVGTHSISISHPSHRKLSSSILVTEGASNVVVIYLQSSERTQADGKPFPPKISIFSISAYESTGYALKAVSMLPATNHFQFARENIELEFRKVTEVPNWTGGEFQIQHNGKLIGEVSRGRERASYMLLMGTDHQGKNLTAIVSADPQKLPPWMQK
jgi:hypothetical protein